MASRKNVWVIFLKIRFVKNCIYFYRFNNKLLKKSLMLNEAMLFFFNFNNFILLLLIYNLFIFLLFNWIRANLFIKSIAAAFKLLFFLLYLILFYTFGQFIFIIILLIQFIEQHIWNISSHFLFRNFLCVSIRN